MKFKKGATNVWAIVAVLAVLGFGGAWLFADDIDMEGDSPASSSSDVGTPDVELSLSGITSGVSDKEISDNNYELTITKDQLSANESTPIDFTMSASALNGFRSSTGSYIDHQIIYDCSAEDFNNQDDTSDQSKYRAVEYVDNTNKYNITVDDVEFATVNQVSETVKFGADSTAPATFNVQGYEILDKAQEDAYDTSKIGACDVKVDDNKVGTIELKYMEV